MPLPSTPPPEPDRATVEGPVPVSPQHRTILEDSFRGMSRFIGKEPDAQQRETLILCLNQFVSALARENNVSLPNATPSRPKRNTHESGDDDAGGGEDEDENSNESEEEGGEEGGEEAMQDVRFTAINNRDRGEVEDQLESLTLAMTSEAGTEQLEKVRNAFFQELVKMRVKVTADNRTKVVGFAQDEAAEITNFFFVEMMGPKALGRLGSLVRLYTAELDDGMDRGAAARAQTLAEMADNPLSIRRFFNAFSKAQSTRTSSTSGLAHMHQITLSINLLEQYGGLRRMAAGKDPALLAFLKGRNYSTRRGRGWQSCIVQFLAESLEISPTTLQNTCQSALGVAALTDQFGNGIIPVLPLGVMNRLNRWGNQRMARVYPLLKERVPFIQPICDILEEYIYDPIQAGAPLRMQQIKAGSSKPFLDKVKEAIGSAEDENDEAGDARGEDGAGNNDG